MEHSQTQTQSHDPSSHNHLVRTETLASLADLGVTEDIPPLDFNFPEAGRRTDPEFPEEYTLETATGIVPEHLVQQIRSHATAVTQHRPSSSIHGQSPAELEKGEQPREFVTFTINDPENPQNWSNLFRWTVTILVSFLVVCIAFGSSIVTGGLGLIEAKYNVSLEVAILTCSIMVLGFAVGPLLWSP